jgi:hypothetical protein
MAANDARCTVQEAVQILENQEYTLFEYNACYGGESELNQQTEDLIETLMGEQGYSRDQATLTAVEAMGTKKCMKESGSQFGSVLVKHTSHTCE